jgi:hypothetical protein
LVRGVVRRVGPFSLEGWLVFLFVGVVILGVTTCNARRDGARSERIRQAEAVGYRAAKASLARRHITDSAVSASRIAERSLIASVSANRKVEARLSATLASNDSLLSAYALTAGANDTAYTLYVALQRTTEVARLFRDSTEVVLRSVADLLSAHEAERQAWMAEREANTKLLAAKDSVISALRESEQGCRILFLPCPSRVQAVLIGGAGTLALLLLL